MRLDNLYVAEGRLLDLLLFLSTAPEGLAFVVDESGHLLDLMDGSKVRWLLEQGHTVDEPLINVIGDDCPYVDQSGLSVGDGRCFPLLPVVDSEHRVIDVTASTKKEFIPVAEPSLGIKEFGYLAEACLSGWISSSGHYVGQFEKLFSSYCTSPYGVAVSNGTTALHLALAALEIGPGDEVIVPDLTFAATINTVLYTGATPVIVDIDSDSWCIDPQAVAAAVSSRTKAIIPVHLYGQPCDMAAIMVLAQEHGLYVIEDCAEAHGAEFDGQKVGSIGDIGCFSFFGNKIITTGEGGMCTTASPELDARMRLLRDHGMVRGGEYKHEVVGFNYRMTNLQAAIGLAQVERIDQILVERKQIELNYRSQLQGRTNIEFQRDLDNRERVVWLTSVLVDPSGRTDIIESLRANSIDTRPFFCPLSQMDIYRKYVHSCRQSCTIAERGLNLPTFSGVDVSAVTSLLCR